MAGPIFPPGGYLNPYEGDRVQTTDEETQWFVASTAELAQTQNGNQTSWRNRSAAAIQVIQRVGPQAPATPPVVVTPPVEPPSPETLEGLNVHIADETPHPAYDDQPSLVLWFENQTT